MYKEYKSDLSFLSNDSVNKIFADIQKHLSSEIRKGADKPLFYGAFCYENVENKEGKKVFIWLEFDAKIVSTPPIGIGFDIGIGNVIMYDDYIPDVILDRYNIIKSTIRK